MGINLNDRDYGRQYDFNVPQEGSGPAGGYHYGTGSRETYESHGTGFKEAPEGGPPAGRPRRKTSPLFRLLAILLVIAILMFIVSHIVRQNEESILPSDRGTIPYSSMVYERPDTDLLFSMIDNVAENGDSYSYSEITAELDRINELY